MDLLQSNTISSKQDITMETIVTTNNSVDITNSNNNNNNNSGSSSSSSVGTGTETGANENDKDTTTTTTTTNSTTTNTTTINNNDNNNSSSTVTNNTSDSTGDINLTPEISNNNDHEKNQTNSSFDPAANINGNNNNSNSNSSSHNNNNNNNSANQHQSTNLKLKRCKHGRIIVKDPSKKKPVQLPPPPLGNRVIELPKAVQLEASPKKSLSARLSMTPSSNNSESSDIYDPEEPIEPISPVDSPPLSPVNKAANHHKITYRLDGDKNDDDVPSSAVQLNHQEKYLQKLNRQERVVEEVKVALKPHYQRRTINKEQYKDVLRRAVPKICHSKNGEINPVKIRALVEAYVKKMKRH